MATTILVPGELSGKEYRVRIAGTEPTADEREQIDAFVRQQEREFAVQYQNRFGENLLPSTGLVAQGTELVRGIPRGLGSLLESAALGGVTPLEEGNESWLREGIRGVGQSWQDQFAVPVGREGMVGSALGEGLGSTVPFYALSALGPPGIAAAAALAVSAGSGTASERARVSDATQEERNRAAQLGGLLGVSDVAVPAMLRGVFGRMLQSGVPAATIRARLSRIATAATTEGAQEAASEFLQNAIALGYDPEQDLAAGLLPSGGTGAGVGAIIQGLVELGTRGRLPTIAPPPPAPPTLALPPPSAFPPAPPPRVINVPPTGPEQVRSQPGSNLPAYPRPPAVTPPPASPAAGPAAAAPATDEFDVPATIAALRTYAANRPLAAKALGINIPAINQRVRHLESTGDITIARDGTMVFNDTPGSTVPADAAAPVEGAAPAVEPAPTVPTAPAVAPAAKGSRGTRPTVKTQPTGEFDVEQAVQKLNAQVKEEMADAETPQTGPVGSDTGAGGAGPARDIAQPDIRPAAADNGPAGVELPLGGAVGKPVLGASGALAPTGEQRPALTAPLNPGAPAQGIALAQPVAPPVAPASVSPIPAPASAEPEPALAYTPGVSADYAPMTGAAPGAVTNAPRPAPPRFQPQNPTRAETEVDPAATAREDAAALRRAPSDAAGMTLVMDNLGLGQTSSVRKAVRRGTLATPEAFVQAVAQAKRLPPDVKAKRDAWVEGARVQAVEDARAAEDPAVSAVVRKIEEARRAADTERALGAWFDSNASEELKLADELYPAGERETTQMSAADMTAVLGLVQSTKGGSGANPSPAQAAARYFERTPDPGYALHMLAYDGGTARFSTPAERGPGIRAPKSIVGLNEDAGYRGSPAARADIALMRGQGWAIAQKAEAWLEANLTPDGWAQYLALRDGTSSQDSVGYKPFDYGAQSKRRDATKENRTDEEQARIEEEAAARAASTGATARETLKRSYTGETRKTTSGVSLPQQPWSASLMAGKKSWLSEMHPTVAALVRKGKAQEAVELLAITARNPHMRQLAMKLAPRLAGVRSQILDPISMDTFLRVFDPTGNLTAEGLYIAEYTPAQVMALRAEKRDDAADLMEKYQGQMLFNADSVLSPELLLHEATHAASHRVLVNPSHPLTRQIEQLRVDLLKSLPPTHYGLSHRAEVLTEGMTNPQFRAVLSTINVNGKPYSAWTQFKTIMRNWLRSLLGKPPTKPDSVLDELDRILNAVLAANPNEIYGGAIADVMFSAKPAEGWAGLSRSRVRVPTKQDVQTFRSILQNTSVPASWKGTMLRAAVPLDYVADMAGRYFKSARAVHDAVLQHQAEIKRATEEVNQTMAAIGDTLKKHRRDQPLIDNIRRLLFQSSVNMVDPRKPRSAYEGYSFFYTKTAADGRMERVESPRFKDEGARNRALAAHNRALAADAPNFAKARRSFDEKSETLQDYDRLRKIYEDVVRTDPGLRAALNRAFALPVQMGKELQTAIRARIDALIPNQKALQNRIFGEIYDKILKGNLIDPYQPFRREGNFWLSYEAVDPESVEYDASGRPIPGSGTVEVFKHSFLSEAARNFAIAQLRSAPADQKIDKINPYQNVGSMRARDRVPLEFVARVLDTIETSDAFQGEQGQKVRAQIIETMFDTLPETSFVQSFRKRANVRGFIADMTPITENMVSGDLLGALQENSQRIGRQVADLKYGAQFSGLRAALDTEAREVQGAANFSGAERAEAAQLFDVLLDYTRAPFQQRSSLSRALTGGAYFLTLGFNASTALITLSQVPLFVAPMLAGKYGVKNTLAAVRSAHGLLAGSGKTREVRRVGEDGQMETTRIPVRAWDYSIENYDFDIPDNAYLRALHDTANANGVLNRSLMQDELLSETPTLWEKISGWSGVLQHHAERYSRETALISAYHLELQRLAGDSGPLPGFLKKLRAGSTGLTEAQMQEAAKEAVDTSEKTNGPIYAAAGPLWSQGNVGAVAYLFKRHPLAMMNLIMQTGRRSVLNADPADKKIAQRQLAGVLGMTTLMAGVLGLPFMQQVGWLYDGLFADDDEPDFETVMRINLGEAGAFGLIDYITDTKISERIGLSGAMYRPGFGADKLPLPYQILEGFGGPVVGLTNKYVSRLPQLAAEGEWGRFLEGAVPSAFGNMLRAYRYANEGALSMRGDPIVEDFAPLSLFGQFFGFMPAEYAQQLAINSVGSRINNAIIQKRTDLLSQRYAAFRLRDMETVREIDEKIREFNQRHPYNQITSETIEDSLRSNEQTTARMQNGVAVDARNLQRIRELSDAFGPSSIWE